ncbi:MAG: TolC family protein [Verrucomicrobiota bacterium]|nr:TolC family protein [Verrucomicrobiota bacterium]
MLKLNLLIALLATFITTPLVHAQTPRLLDAAFLDSLRAEVRTNHPSIAAAKARVQAAEASVRAVRLWEDPMAGMGVMAAERDMRADDGDLMFMVEQVLPRRKLYEARKAKAAAERSMFEAETRSAVLTLETLVAQTALELAFLDEMFAVETNQLVWLESMAANAREKLKDPMATASEPLRVESEVAQEQQKIDSTTRTRTRLTRQLNILLGRPADEMWPILRLPESASLTPALEAELNRLFEVNPMLQALLNTANAAKSEIEVARKERSPIFSVGVGSSVYSGGDFRQATVTAKMTLPFFNKSIYAANVERAQRQELAAEKEIEAIHRKLRGEAVAAHTEAENAARQADTFSKEVIPRAQIAAESIQNSWIGAKSTLLEVLESRRAMLNARLEERRSVAAHRAALETLRSIVPPQTLP